MRDVLAGFGGGRVVIGVTSTPFKCPPAPSETALLTHEFLTARGLRSSSEIALVMPLPSPVPPLPDASDADDRLRRTWHRNGDVTFAGGRPPFGHFDTATEAASAEKDGYGASRQHRWIGAD